MDSIFDLTGEYTPESPQAIMAQGLRSAVREVYQFGKYNEPEWISEFTKLTEEVGIESVKTVLHWYAEHIGEEFVPKCYSAKTFRIKFPRVRLAMLRDDPKKIVVSDAAKTAMYELSDLRWGSFSKAELAAAVQLSLENYSHFYERFCRLRADVVAKKRVLSDRYIASGLDNKTRKEYERIYSLWMVLEHVLRDHLCSPIGFVQRWFAFHNERIKRSDEMTIMNYVWYPGSRYFAKMGKIWVLEEFGDVGMWDKFMEEMGEKE